MQGLGPFDPLSISSGVFTNLAYDILKYRLQSSNKLEGTLIGKSLKWAGIMEPNFEERIRETLSKALGVLFKEHPQYDLGVVIDFFRDEAVATQIADYILDRRQFDYNQLQQVFDQHFKDAYFAEKILFQRKSLSSKQLMEDFELSYRRVLGEQLSVPQMGLLLDMVEQTNITITEIQVSEQRLKEYINTLLSTKLSPQALQTAYQTGQQQLVKELTEEVRASVASASNQTATQHTTTTEATAVTRGTTQTYPSLFTDGLCSGYFFQPTPDQYFVSHSFGSDTLADWREAIVDAMSHEDISSTPLKPYFSGDTVLGGFRLCGLCEKLYSATFSLFLLPAETNPNVYIELGIAIGLGKPFFLVQERNALLPPILAGLGLYTQQGSLLTMRRELGGKVKEYNFGAVRFLKDQVNIPAQHQYFIGAGEQYDDEDFEWAITASVEKAFPQRFTAVSFSTLTKGKASDSFGLKHLVETIQSSRFSFYRIDEECSATTFLALGISLGLSQPFVMLHKTNSIPIDLRGMSTYKFPNFTTLTKELAIRYRAFINRYAQ